jgi:pimeloyl-ACP methyl ester carboxylesterase
MIKKFGIVLLILIAMTVGRFVIWANSAMPAMPEAIQTLDQPIGVTVSTDKWISLIPDQQTPVTTGYIFYPGARVDYRAYAPALVEIAQSGTQVFLTRMPLNMAIFSPSLADEIIQANPQIQYWVIGGHSLGGAMAAQYAYSHPDKINGLILLAAYATKDSDLSKSSVSALTISGTNDGLATPDDIQASLQWLPTDATWIQIEGGNHAQMGWYGDQSGDNPASISREEQQDQIISASIDLLKKVQQLP